jgi:opacity protein-like surface antigen
MKKLILAAAAATLFMPAAALADHVVTSPNGMVLDNPEVAEGFDNRGQCMAAFRQLRNEQRKSGERGGEPYNSMSNGDYNEASRTTTRCEEIEGRYYVVFSADGF